MPKQLMKGNEAIIRSAIISGCRAFYGYPITPASEIAEGAARLMPEVGGVFLQAESEVAAINMIYGGAAAGVRVMTASSGPGISLMQEGVSYLAGAELPCVIVDITRGGPGLGNLAPEQSDYNQLVKGGGHGSYKCIVLAPDSVQEMADLAALAFELADRYRNPVYLLADGFIGQMMEAVQLPLHPVAPQTPTWAVDGTAATRHNYITSIQLLPDLLEKHVRHLEAKYNEISRREVRYEEYLTSDAELVVVGYGIVARILQRVVDKARAHGIRAGLLRPVTLFPFPAAAVRRLAGRARTMVTVELSTGQMVDDVRLAVDGRCPVEFYSRVGGNVPSSDELLQMLTSVAERELCHA